MTPQAGTVSEAGREPSRFLRRPGDPATSAGDDRDREQPGDDASGRLWRGLLISLVVSLVVFWGPFGLVVWWWFR